MQIHHTKLPQKGNECDIWTLIAGKAELQETPIYFENYDLDTIVTPVNMQA